MKLLVEIEDQLAGIFAGVMIIAFTERYFKIPYSKTLLIISLVVFFIFLVLDIIYNFKDIGGQHIWWMILAQVSSLIDIALVASMFSWLTKINLPFVTERFVPYLDNPTIVLAIGFFFVISSILWLIIYFTDFWAEQSFLSSSYARKLRTHFQFWILQLSAVFCNLHNLGRLLPLSSWEFFLIFAEIWNKTFQDFLFDFFYLF